MDTNSNLVNNLQKDMNVLHTDIDKMNSKLKKVLTKMRAPNKLCMDISLSFVLAILIGTFIWVIRMYMNLSV